MDGLDWADWCYIGIVAGCVGVLCLLAVFAFVIVAGSLVQGVVGG